MEISHWLSGCENLSDVFLHIGLHLKYSTRHQDGQLNLDTNRIYLHSQVI